MAVARAGGFSKAMSSLNVTQSAISRQVGALEDVLKVRLFTRTHKGLELTPSGVLLYETVSQVFDTLEDAQVQLIRDTREARGPLKVATSVSLGAFCLAPHLVDFSLQHPDISLSVMAQNYDLDLSKREADVAIRFGSPTQQDLIQRQLGTLKMKLYASPEYLQKRGEPKKITELHKHQLLHYDSDEGGIEAEYRAWLFPKKEPLKANRPFLSINSMLGLAHAAECGLGIAALFSESIEGRNLVPVLPEEMGPSLDIYYVYPERLRGSKKIAVFGDFLFSALGGKRI